MILQVFLTLVISFVALTGQTRASFNEQIPSKNEIHAMIHTKYETADSLHYLRRALFNAAVEAEASKSPDKAKSPPEITPDSELEADEVSDNTFESTDEFDEEDFATFEELAELLDQIDQNCKKLACTFAGDEPVQRVTSPLFDHSTNKS